MKLLSNEVFGLIRPSIDAHTLGISMVAQLLRECGYTVVIGDVSVTDAVAEIQKPQSVNILADWIRKHGISRIGFSYRLDPRQAQESFGKLVYQLKNRKLVFETQSPLRGIYFAGLPAACELITREYKDLVPVFMGDETPLETLAKLGVPDSRISRSLSEDAQYDRDLLRFGANLIEREEYKDYAPQARAAYPEFGTRADSLIKRMNFGKSREQMPIIRAHVGPYNPNYQEAIKEFKTWVGKLAASGYLDVLSIGSSQLTQSHFGMSWNGLANGGGVPVNSAAEYLEIYQAGRPMLFRTYAGTRNIAQLAKIHELSMNIAWHALSFWWFCQIDGRGPLTVYQNLQEHLDTLTVIAQSGKPFEPNIPHHFAFRGGDDVSYVLSAYLAARTAKLKGIRYFILQNMLNTPKYTWGIQDLAKGRAMLRLVKELEDKDFQVILQTRAGLDFFSPDLNKAKCQLAAVTALMDDIDPGNRLSPEIIHVVSFSEAAYLATPEVVDESIKITFQALSDYRKLKQQGKVEAMDRHQECKLREQDLYDQAKTLIKSIETHIPKPYSAEGLYRIFASGYMPVPYLWECRDEFAHAVSTRTALIKGAMVAVDEKGTPLGAQKRAWQAEANASTVKLPGSI